MQSEQINEKAPMTSMQMSQSTAKQNYVPNNSVQKTRTTLLILLGIHMVLALLYFIDHIVGLVKYHNVHKNIHQHDASASHIGNISFSVVLIIYLTVYIVVVFKCLRIGILIFAWLGILELVGLAVIIVIAIIAIATFSAVLQDGDVELVLSVTLLIVSVLTFIFTMLTVVFSFELVKLIKIQHNYQYI